MIFVDFYYLKKKEPEKYGTRKYDTFMDFYHEIYGVTVDGITVRMNKCKGSVTAQDFVDLYTHDYIKLEIPFR